jgi:hypothetical protein
MDAPSPAVLNSCTAAFLKKCSGPGLDTRTSLFLTLRSSPSRRSSASRIGEPLLLTARDAAAGLNSCTAVSLEECSGRSQHLHLTLPYTETSPSPWYAAGRTGEQFLDWDAAAAVQPGSTPAPLSPSKNVPAGLSTCTRLQIECGVCRPSSFALQRRYT